MRVLQLGPFPPPHGGVQTNLVAIRSFLRKHGDQCSVINITRHRKPESEDVYYPKSSTELVRLLASLKCDVIHLHIGGLLSKRLLALGFVCTLRPGTKSIMTFHSGGFPSSSQGQSLGPASFAGFVLRRFDGLIAVNEEIMQFFQKLGVPPIRTRLIPPYAFTKDDAPGPSLPESLVSWFAAHDPVLISVGLLEPEYDLSLQIAALPRIRQKFPNAGLLLIGSGSLEAALRATIEANPCALHILLPGDVAHSTTMEAIRRSRLMLRTTLYDGDALSVREAMQMGTPVIATNNGMRPEGVRLIGKSNPSQLVQAVEEELTAQAPVRRENSMTDENNLQAVFDLYQHLLEQK